MKYLSTSIQTWNSIFHRYNASWPLNLGGSRLYEDPEMGEKKFDPARNDDRVNTHNRYILQLWRPNVDW